MGPYILIFYLNSKLFGNISVIHTDRTRFSLQRTSFRRYIVKIWMLKAWVL